GFVGNMGEVIVGKSRIEMRSIPVDARLHGAAERGFRPPSDAGLRVGRDVRGIDDAEWRRHRKTAGKILAAAYRVTVVAVADCRQIAAPLDQRAVKRLRRRRLDRRDRRPPYDRDGRDRADDRGYGDDAPDHPRRCHGRSHLDLSRIGTRGRLLPRTSIRRLTKSILRALFPTGPPGGTTPSRLGCGDLLQPAVARLHT